MEVLNVRISVEKPDLAEQLQNVVCDARGVALMTGSRKGVPDLLILELGDSQEEDFARIEGWLKEGKVREVFLVADLSDPAILMRAMRAGVKEFFPLPLDPAELARSLDRFRERVPRSPIFPHIRKPGLVISLGGCKGGVGATTVAVNLAVAFRESGTKPSVVLMDMNTLVGEVPLFLDISPKFHWGEITKNIDRLDDAFLMKVLTPHKSGVYVLPSPAYLDGHHAPTPDIMQRLIEVMRQAFDVIIIDAGLPMGDAPLKAMQLSDKVLMISVLSLPCLSNTVRILRSYIDLGYVPKEKIEVILNRYVRKSELSTEDAGKSIGKPIFWTIPNDYMLSMSAINSGKPLSYMAPHAEIVRSFKDLAEKLVPLAAPKEEKKRWRLFKR